MDRDAWQFINSFAPWLSATGTISAVVMSLYLATRDKKIRLKVNAGLRKLVMPGQKLAQGTDIVSITVTNVGYRAATINSLYWKVGFFKKAHIVQMPENLSALPTKLADGDEASFPLNLPLWAKDIGGFLDVIPSSFPKIGVKSIKIGACTTSGERFESKIEPRLQKWFLEQLEKRKGDNSKS
jgi:hypothetical protein